jgi:hypothetical protein
LNKHGVSVSILTSILHCKRQRGNSDSGQPCDRSITRRNLGMRADNVVTAAVREGAYAASWR